MPNLVIVAIPEADDPVWRISSEPVPHMTILFLGNNPDPPNKVKMVGFLAHAAKTSLCRFGLEVDHRGTLGEDEADVVFFDDSWELPRLREFRSNLLQDNNIRAAYDSVEQFPEWQPHLTLGYPDSPAKKQEGVYSDKIYYVQFDRVAIWDSDYSGIEFQLDKYHYAPEVAAMSETSDRGAEFLAHYGVLGMKWGVRRARTATEVQTRETVGLTNRSNTKIKTSGGENHPASQDALKVAATTQKLKKSGVKALSNQELKDAAERLRLEAEVSRLTGGHKSPGKKFVDEALRDPAKTIDTATEILSTYQKTKNS